MTHRYREIAFTDAVKAVQEELGSAAMNAEQASRGAEYDRLGEAEVVFLSGRDSFYLASLSETGWPYVQHRGGPKGFVRVLDEATIGWAEFAGNRQYVTTGNLRGSDRVSLFFM
ncbi:MAG: pyridoxamine 5'-phosphate oxidase family protein, partial [Mangrovicoccus sp.]|nr:pyridoxamine 5'-phosphate oxidase family protein [Mangrovicoccus sp.]